MLTQRLVAGGGTDGAERAGRHIAVDPVHGSQDHDRYHDHPATADVQYNASHVERHAAAAAHDDDLGRDDGGRPRSARGHLHDVGAA